MGHMNLFENTKVTYATTAAAGSTVIVTKFVDMRGFEGCMWIVQLTSLAANSSKHHISFQGSTADSTSGAVTYKTIVTKATARAKSSAVGRNYRLIVADCHKPTHRYIRGRFYSTDAGDCSTGDSVAGGIAIQYNARYSGTTTFCGLYSTHVLNGGVVVGGTS